MWFENCFVFWVDIVKSTIFPDMHSNVFCPRLHFMSMSNWTNKSRRKTRFLKVSAVFLAFLFLFLRRSFKTAPTLIHGQSQTCFMAQPLRYSRETFKSVETDILVVRNNNLRSGGLRRLGFTAGIDFVTVPTSLLTCWSAFYIRDYVIQSLMQSSRLPVQ